MKAKPRTLTCGCCSKNFTGIQYWNHDTGYGVCQECVYSILGTPRWWDLHDDTRKCAAVQWPQKGK